MRIFCKKLDKRAILPDLGTAGSAGADLRAVLDNPIVIKPKETSVIRTGLAIAIPEGYVGLLYARSGLASKRGLAPSNKVGVIDADYRGEVLVSLYNHGTEEQEIQPGERIAQLIIQKYEKCKYEEVDELDDTERGNGGFGSTGKM